MDHQQDQEQIALTITDVRYSRLISTGDYSNESLGITASVPPGVEGSVVVDACRLFVADRLQSREQVRDLHQEVTTKIYELANLTRQVAAMQQGDFNQPQGTIDLSNRLTPGM